MANSKSPQDTTIHFNKIRNVITQSMQSLFVEIELESESIGLK